MRIGVSRGTALLDGCGGGCTLGVDRDHLGLLDGGRLCVVARAHFCGWKRDDGGSNANQYWYLINLFESLKTLIRQCPIGHRPSHSEHLGLSHEG